MSDLKSFGVSYFSPYIPKGKLNTNSSYFVNPMWKRETRGSFLNTKRPCQEEKYSMQWKYKNKEL